MQDFELIEIVDCVRSRVSERVDDLDVVLSRCVWTDFRMAPAWDLMAALAQLITGLDGRRPADARRIQAWINRAHAVENGGVGCGGAAGESAGCGGGLWVIRENLAAGAGAGEVDVAWPDEFQARAIRFLSLSGVCVHDGVGVGVDGGLGDLNGGGLNSGGTPLGPFGAGIVPTRFGQELLRCSDVGEALGLVRRRLPRLKPLVACEFLGVIGFEIAPPLPDVVRLCEYLGLLGEVSGDVGVAGADGEVKAGDGSGPGKVNGSGLGKVNGSGTGQVKSLSRVAAQAVELTAVLGRAARLACLPLGHLVHLLALYSGARAGVSVGGAGAVCVRNLPACDVCGVTRFCGRFRVEQGRVTAERVRGGRGVSIKEWAADERPRERLLAGERLSNSELLGIILRTGCGGLSAVELGRKVIGEFGTLHDLQKASPGEIISRLRGSGIGPAKAAEICAAIELGRRATQPAADSRSGLRSVVTSRDIFESYRSRFKSSVQEEFLLLVLDSRSRIQKELMVSMGTINQSLAHPRDVFRLAVREAAFAVMFVHNHPSGDPAPSEQDFLITARLSEAGRLLGIEVMDHVIIGSHEWYSFRDHGRMP